MIGIYASSSILFADFSEPQLVGTYAKVDTKEMNFCAAEYLAARVLYSVLYMSVRSETASYLRSAVYVWSVGIPFYVLWKAGKKIAEEGGDDEKEKL